MNCIYCSKSFETDKKLKKHSSSILSKCFLKSEIDKYKQKSQELTIQLEELLTIKHQLDIERTKTNIYKQILEQTMNIKISDTPETIDIYTNNITINIHNSITNTTPILETPIKPSNPFISKPKAYSTSKSPSILPTIQSDINLPVLNLDNESEIETGSEMRYTVEEDDVMSINPYNGDSIKDKLSEYFDLSKDSINIIETAFENIKTKKVYNDSIKIIKKERSNLLATYNIESYVELVKTHMQRLTDIFKEKKQPETKIKKTILTSISPLEQRLLFYDKYYKVDFEFDNAEKFQIASIYRNKNTNKIFNLNSIVKCITNYGFALYPISKNIDKVLFNSPELNLIYYPIQPKTADAFSFYKLDRVVDKDECGNNYIRYWVLDCRLEHFTTQLMVELINYMEELFRKIYYDVFCDNNYRYDYISHLGSIELELEQLIQNFISVSDHINFNKFIKNVVIKYATYIPSLFDNFNLKSDDTLQKRITNEENNVNMISYVKRLFDDISDEDAYKFICKNKVDLLSHKY